MPEDTIGSRLRSHRKIADLTQKAVARRVGREPQQVWRWENDRTVPSLLDLLKLASLYKATLDELVPANAAALAPEASQ